MEGISMKYIEGPYELGTVVSGSGCSAYVDSKHGVAVASVGNHHLRMAGVSEQYLVKAERDEIVNTARLFSAAPELLAALEVALNRLYEIEETEELDRNTTSEVYELIEGAIAKAKGGTA
jgi:hypothetical protein